MHDAIYMYILHLTCIILCIHNIYKNNINNNNFYLWQLKYIFNIKIPELSAIITMAPAFSQTCRQKVANCVSHFNSGIMTTVSDNGFLLLAWNGST